MFSGSSRRGPLAADSLLELESSVFATRTSPGLLPVNVPRPEPAPDAELELDRARRDLVDFFRKTWGYQSVLTDRERVDFDRLLTGISNPMSLEVEGGLEGLREALGVSRMTAKRRLRAFQRAGLLGQNTTTFDATNHVWKTGSYPLEAPESVVRKSGPLSIHPVGPLQQESGPLSIHPVSEAPLARTERWEGKGQGQEQGLLRSPIAKSSTDLGNQAVDDVGALPDGSPTETFLGKKPIQSERHRVKPDEVQTPLQRSALIPEGTTPDPFGPMTPAEVAAAAEAWGVDTAEARDLAWMDRLHREQNEVIELARAEGWPESSLQRELEQIESEIELAQATQGGNE